MIRMKFNRDGKDTEVEGLDAVMIFVTPFIVVFLTGMAIGSML